MYYYRYNHVKGAKFLVLRFYIFSNNYFLLNFSQIVLWLIIWWKPIPPLMILSKMFFAGFSVSDTSRKFFYCSTTSLMTSCTACS